MPSSSPFDLLLSGRIFFGGKLRYGRVYLKAGIIARVATAVSDNAGKKISPRQKTEIRLGPDQLLVPAATDLHVHLRDWNQSYKETVETGTKAALAGGVTTVAEMPNTDPKLNTAENVERRIRLLEERSYVDVAVHAGVPERASELERMRRAGAFCIKIYSQEIPRFQELARIAAKLRMKIAVHAEEDSMVGTGEEERAEEECVKGLLPLIRKDMDLRFAHISTEKAATLISRKRKQGFDNLSMEVTPHHLFMTKSLSESRIGAAASAVRPPLRGARNVEKMTSFLKKRSFFDFYATDHAPHSRQEKFEGRPLAPGFSALEVGFPLLLTMEGVERACKLYCENPSRYLGIRKGLIEAGYEADLVIVSKRPWVIDPSRFTSLGKVTPFQGDRMDYAVDMVFKAGEVAYDGNAFHRRSINVVRKKKNAGRGASE